MTKAKTVEIKIDKTNLFREYDPEIFSEKRRFFREQN